MSEQQNKVAEILVSLKERLTEEELHSLAEAILGELGKKRRGESRAEKLTPERRTQTAIEEAKDRWKKH